MFCMYCDICTFVDCFYTIVCRNKSSTELMLHMFKHVRQKIKFLNLNLKNLNLAVVFRYDVTIKALETLQNTAYYL